jgi:hypothetical protein
MLIKATLGIAQTTKDSKVNTTVSKLLAISEKGLSDLLGIRPITALHQPPMNLRARE